MTKYVVKENAEGIFLVLQGIVKNNFLISQGRRINLRFLSQSEGVFDHYYIALKQAEYHNHYSC